MNKCTIKHTIKIRWKAGSINSIGKIRSLLHAGLFSIKKKFPRQNERIQIYAGTLLSIKFDMGPRGMNVDSIARKSKPSSINNNNYIHEGERETHNLPSALRQNKHFRLRIRKVGFVSACIFLLLPNWQIPTTIWPFKRSLKQYQVTCMSPVISRTKNEYFTNRQINKYREQFIDQSH